MSLPLCFALQNVRIDTVFPAKYFEVLGSSVNGSYHQVKALEQGLTLIEATLRAIVNKVSALEFFFSFFLSSPLFFQPERHCHVTCPFPSPFCPSVPLQWRARSFPVASALFSERRSERTRQPGAQRAGCGDLQPHRS